MEEITKKFKPYVLFLTWIISVLSFIWIVFGIFNSFKQTLKITQKSTLRNTIWNETIPMHDRLESCDEYLSLGYNSETKKYCKKLLEKI